LHERAVDTARPALELAEWRLERTEIRSPFGRTGQQPPPKSSEQKA
jgi:multidrug resistance efflux pump